MIHLNVLLHTYRSALFFIVCTTALIVGMVLRIQHLEALHPFEADERAWLLIGTSLLNTGVPASWTIYWEKYPSPETILYGGTEHLVVTPFLDHPPLFGIGMGIWAAITENNTASALNWATLRIPMILLSLGTILFTSLFIRTVFSASLAASTLIAFSFFPAHIVASRFIAAEHIIAFLLSVCLYAMAFIDTAKHKTFHKKSLALAIIFLICSTAILFKLSAIIIPSTVICIALLRKNWPVFIGASIAAALSAVFLACYGAYYDFDIFLGVLGGHTERSQSFWHFWSLFTQMDLGYFAFRDPSFIVGFIGIFALLINTGVPWEKRLYLFTPLLNLSLLFLFIAPVEAYGWYKYAFFPLLAIGLGYIFHEFIKGNIVYYALILPFIAVLMEHSYLPGTHARQKAVLLILYGIAALVILAKQYNIKTKLFLPITGTGMIALLFFLELVWVSSVLR